MFKDYDKYLSTSLKVYLFVLVIIFIMKIVGLDYFGLDLTNPTITRINEFCIKYHLINIWYCITLYLYAYIITSISSNNKNVHKIVITFMPIIILTKIINMHYPVVSFILDILVLCTMTKVAKGNPINTIKFLILNFIYQLISLTIRNKNIVIDQNDFIQAIIFNFDYILLCLITYEIYFNSKKGVIKPWVDLVAMVDLVASEEMEQYG